RRHTIFARDWSSDVCSSDLAWVMGANASLPPDISVTWAKVMPADFHARFKACARRYRYVIYNDPIRPAHLAGEVTWNHRPLDVEIGRASCRERTEQTAVRRQ